MSVQKPVIQTRNYGKVYRTGRSRETVALSALNLEVRPGEIFGYLGPNGAGKTTTIRLLLDLIRPTEGSASIFGMDARDESIAIHRRVGFLPGELSLWKNRTGRQVMRYLASVRGGAAAIMKEGHELAERLELDLSKKVRDYSSGNKRKLGLVLAMMHHPDLLILDEPTGGLDPLVQQTFNEIMREVRNEGRTVFLSSHVLSEVQAICDRVGILRDGKLQAVESVSRLTHVEFRWVEFQFAEAPPAETVAGAERVDGVSDVRLTDDTLRLRLNGDFDPLLRALNSHYIKHIRVEEPTLEEVFLTYYGGNNRHAAPKAEAAKETI